MSRTYRKHKPRARKMRHPFSAEIPKHWLAGNPFATHHDNSLNLLFPAGERFFIRSVRYYLDRFRDDPQMMEAIQGFFGQEGTHAREHERFFEILEAQGYRIRTFLKWYERICYGYLEPLMPPHIRLAVTAAAEHYTATMGALGLQDPWYAENAHPIMRDLFMWHAAEEIEHKAVAYDVLQEVDPRYSTRVIGMALATLMLLTCWGISMQMLLRQDGVDRQSFERAKGALPQYSLMKDVFLPAIREYLRPDFHPWQNDNLHLAEQYLKTRGAA